MSDHQPANGSDHDGDATMAPAEGDRDRPQETVGDPHEPDFSRLRMARASLDAAFPED